MRGRAELTVEQVSPRMHVAITPHVNWAIYRGTDGTTLIDSGYPGQFPLLRQSLREVGVDLDDVAAVLITHAHIDHLGGAARLNAEFGTPVVTSLRESAHLRRDYLEQAGVGDVLGALRRPGVLRWAFHVLPLMDGDPARSVPGGAEFDIVDGRVVVPGGPRALSLSGHTSGHTGYEFEAEGVLVLGDAVVTGHGTTRRYGPQLLPTMFHHDLASASASVNGVADSSATVFIPGHGPVWRGSATEIAREARLFGAEW